MPLNNYHSELMGRAEISPRGEFEAGSWSSFTLVYTAGKFGIDDQGGLKIGFRGHFDGSALQMDDPSAPGYTAIETSNGIPIAAVFETRRNIRPWNKSLFIRCLRFLKEGDTVTIKFGDTSKGSPGFLHQTFCESEFMFQVLVDAFATHDFTALPEDKNPKIAIVSGKPVNWKALLPTCRKPGDAFRLSIKAEDCWGNPSNQISQKIQLRSSAPIDGLPDDVEFSKGKFTAEVEGLSVGKPGKFEVQVLDRNGVELCKTNTLVVRDSPVRHYWSDMHGQSKETIGINSAREYFDFARNKGFVDIGGHQGNDFQITDAFWKELNELTEEFDEPGRFLAIPGYEWSGNTGLGGDHNVWYRNEGRPIYRSSRALIEDRTHMHTDTHTSQDLIDQLKEEDALVVAHVGGRYADVKYAHDANLEPSVEVHSAWGTFEWILWDALESNYRVGIVASSDGHKGRPGASYPGDSAFGSYGGLTCHLMEDLTRDSLFKAFRQRHHYATTGARIFLSVSAVCSDEINTQNLDGAHTIEIGDIVETACANVAMRIEIEGTAPIERVDIFDGFKILKTYRPWDMDASVPRLRITCAGQNYRGRGRLVRWKGDAKISKGEIEKISAVNFWNPNKQPSCPEANTLNWEVVTTGGASSVDLFLSEEAWEGEVSVDTNEASAKVKMQDVNTEGLEYECGGMDKRLILSRLPGEMNASSMLENHVVPLTSHQEARLFVRVIQEDGHRAWSSPMYISRNS